MFSATKQTQHKYAELRKKVSETIKLPPETSRTARRAFRGRS
jgi:hypothetical protein